MFNKKKTFKKVDYRSVALDQFLEEAESGTYEESNDKDEVEEMHKRLLAAVKRGGIKITDPAQLQRMAVELTKGSMSGVPDLDNPEMTR